MLVEDLAPLFADFGLTAVFGGNVATVLLDMPQEEVFGGMQQSAEYDMTFKQGDLPGLKGGDVGTVGGITYTVRQTTTLDDGKLIKAMLKR